MSRDAQGLTTQQSTDKTQESTPSFSDRYYNEAPTKSVGGSRSVRSVSQSIPYGSENGGLTDWFKEKILRKKPKTDGEEDGLEMETLGPIDDESEDDEGVTVDTTEDEDEDDGEVVDVTDEEGRSVTLLTEEFKAHDGMLKLADEIKADTKQRAGVTLKDGDIYTALKEALSELTRLLAGKIKDKKEDTQAFKNDSLMVTYWYRMAIEHCQRYMEHIKGKKLSNLSDFGRRRLTQVQTLLPLLRNEMFWIQSFTQDGDNSKAGKTYDDVLFKIRSEDVSVDTEGVTAKGNGPSVVYEKTGEDGSVSYIQEEESTAAEGSGIALARAYHAKAKGHSFFDLAWQYFIDYPELLTEHMIYSKDKLIRVLIGKNETGVNYPAKKPEQSDEEYRTAKLTFFKDHVTFERIVPELAEAIKSTTYEEMLEEWANCLIYMSNKSEEFKAAQEAKIAPGTALTDRNVSSSILARNLGVSDMIAESQTVLIDKGDGEKKARGIMTAQAKGMSITELEAAAAEEEKRINRAGRKNVKTVRVLYTPKAAKQVQMLQIFDMISGQVNRRREDYLFTYDKTTDDKGNQIWYLTGLTGTENEFSFGNLTAGDLKEQWVTPFAYEGDARVKINSIRFISKEFYDRIMTYSPEQAGFDQAHIRTMDEIEALRDRLTFVRSEIERRVRMTQIVADKKKDGKEPTEEELKNASMYGITLTTSDEEDRSAFEAMASEGAEYYSKATSGAEGTDEEKAAQAKETLDEMDDSTYLMWEHMEGVLPVAKEEPKKKRQHKSKHKAKEAQKAQEQEKKKKKSKPKGGKKKSDYHKKKEEEEDDGGVELE